jgi:hypothetical protein
MMDIHTATETAYKNGYARGFADAKEKFATAIRKMTPQFVLVPKGFEGISRTRYHCPSCKAMTRDHEKFCHKCGQAVKYPKVVVSKAENKLVLDWSDSK